MKILICTSCFSAFQIQANPLSLSHVKIFENLQPNILVTVDDSISIDWEISTTGEWTLSSYLSAPTQSKLFGVDSGLYTNDVTTVDNCDVVGYAYLWYNGDNRWGGCRGRMLFEEPELADADWRVLSSDFNKIYYNPKINYKPWPGYENANFRRARSHPDPSQDGYTMRRDLGNTDFKFAVWQDTAGFSGHSPVGVNATQTANGIIDVWDNFTLYEVRQSNINVTSVQFNPQAGKTCQRTPIPTLEDQVDCFNGSTTRQAWNTPFGRTVAEEQQNIANWYQYHRRRYFALRNVVAMLIKQFPNFRYGLDFTQNYNQTFVEIPQSGANLAEHNAKITEELLTYTQGSAGTPLATALDRAGQYFQGEYNGMPSPITQSCQANYNLLMTDGFWSDQVSYSGKARGDLDNDGASGSGANTSLSDIATYYYTQDLAPQLANDFVSTRERCVNDPLPAHQHLSVIGVTFGPAGKLEPDPKNCWPLPALQRDSDWGNPFEETEDGLFAKIDDLWHAAFNSNGFFTSSANPQVLLTELSQIFSSISQLNASGARGTLASTRLDTANAFIVSQYKLSDNSGTIFSYPSIPENGLLASTPNWTTDGLTGNARFTTGKRHLFSYNPRSSRGLYLSGTNGANQFSQAQRNLLFPQAGDLVQQTQAQTWLDRLAIDSMGATVHSNPAYVGQPSRSKGQQIDAVKEGYFEFQVSQRANLKREMIYVGSNKGLLHGIDLSTGKEVFSYLPDALLNANLPLENTAYTSKLDGQIIAEDVFFKQQNRWRTVIVAGYRYGGTGYFALDVTNPDIFTTSRGRNAVLWEYSNNGTQRRRDKNPNLGYSYSKAAIGRMANGQWAAVFGNGYNSDSETASIIILDIETGQLIREINTGIGAAQDPLNQQRANGMSEPALIDKNQDGIVDIIYAGDFFGHLYAFDVSATSANQWSSKYGSTDTAMPLFSTQGAPITSRPTVMKTLQEDQLMVIAGTGQTMTSNAPNQGANALFGVIDQGKVIASANDLDTVGLSVGAKGWTIERNNAGQTTGNGWIMPLTGQASRFQITTQPQLEFGELTALLTKTPIDPCNLEDTASVILKMKPLTGHSLNRIVFMQDGDETSDNGPAIDGLVIKNAVMTDISLATSGPQGVIIGNTLGGEILQIKTSNPPKTEGRQRFRRLYD